MLSSKHETSKAPSGRKRGLTHDDGENGQSPFFAKNIRQDLEHRLGILVIQGIGKVLDREEKRYTTGQTVSRKGQGMNKKTYP